MKISQRSKPVLAFLEAKNLEQMFVNEDDKIFIDNVKIIDKCWAEHCFYFSKNIEIICDTFSESMIQAQNKLLPILTDKNELISNLPQFHGVLLHKDLAICYNYSINGLVYFIFSKNVLHGFAVQNKEGTITWTSNSDEETLINQCESYVALFLIFKKYATVEIKVLKANSRLKDIECKYINDSKSDVKIFDCKWFTTLVKSEGFKVRGHFRLQPKKKDGEWTKELIWISEFQKTGYTAPARMLSQNAT